MRYLMTFSYDGSNFSGYQKQPKARTIQSEIEKALKQISGGEKIVISASGRTDAKVHANNQKATFDMEKSIELSKLKMGLNSLIPNDIFIKELEKVSDDFHARFSVKSKEYIYLINMGQYNPIERDYVYQYNNELDISAMQRAMKLLEGTNNYKSFSKTDEEKDDYVRTIFKAHLFRDVRDVNKIKLVFSGDGFFRYMIRNMVGTLIEIGEGKRKSEDIIDILKAMDRKKAGVTAPPEGLYLNDVFY